MAEGTMSMATVSADMIVIGIADTGSISGIGPMTGDISVADIMSVAIASMPAV
jgi:hypothetical protein